MGWVRSGDQVYSGKKYIGKTLDELSAEHVENMNGSVRILVANGKPTCDLGREILKEKVARRKK